MVVAFFGHAIWLALAAIIRMFLSLGDPRSDISDRCRCCKARLADRDKPCRSCGHQPGDNKQYDAAEPIFSALKSLWILQSKQQISAEQFNQLAASLSQELEKLGLKPLPATMWPKDSGTAPESSVSEASLPEASLPEASLPVSEVETAENLPGDVVLDAEQSYQIAPAPLPAVRTRTAKVHPLDQVTAPEEAQPKQASFARRTLADVLQAFMEESNIRWGEVVSGVLIVVSAVGLVISLRATLSEKIPYFPALMFLLITAGIHFAGMYSLKKWKLKSTSRGVLLIATLLVPLNCVAATLLTGDHEKQVPITGLTFLSAVAIGFVALTTMNYFAVRELFARGRWQLMVAILGPSFSQIWINRAGSQALSLGGASLLLCVPLACFLLHACYRADLLASRRRLTRRGLYSTFATLGLSLFALLATIAVFLSVSSDPRLAVTFAAPALSLAASAALVIGVLIHRRAIMPHLSIHRMVGTAIAIIAGLLLGVMGYFAWPVPSILLTLGILNFLILTFLAIFAKLSVLHPLALISLAWSVLVGGAWSIEGLDGSSSEQGLELVQSLQQPVSSALLTGLALLALIVSGGLSRFSLHRHAQGYLAGAAGLMVGGALLALRAAFVWTPIRHNDILAAVFLVQSVTAILAAHRLKIQWPAIVGSLLGFVACFHALQENEHVRTWLSNIPQWTDNPWIWSLLIHSVAASLFLTLVGRPWLTGPALAQWSSGRQHLIQPLLWTGLLSAALAVNAVALNVDEWSVWHAVRVCTIAVPVALCAWAQRSALLTISAQVVATIGVSLATHAVFHVQYPWSDSIQDEAVLFCVLIAVLAAWNTVMILGRYVTNRWLLKSPSASPPLYTLEYFLGAAIVLAVSLFSVAYGLPAVGIFGPSFFPHLEFYWQSAPTQANWWALASSGLMLAVPLCIYRLIPALLGLVILSASLPCMAASYMETHVGKASALNWGVAIYLVAWFMPIVLRKRIASAFSSWRWQAGLVRSWTAPGVIVYPAAVLSLVAIAGVCLSASLMLSFGGWFAAQLNTILFAQLGFSWTFGIPLAIVVLAFIAVAVAERRGWCMLAASLVFQLLITLQCALAALAALRFFDQAYLNQLAVWNALGLGVFGCLWMILLPWIRRPDDGASLWLPRGQLALAGAVNLLIGFLAFRAIDLSPKIILPEDLEFAGWTAIASLFALIAAWCLASRVQIVSLIHGLAYLPGILLAAVIFLAIRQDPVGYLTNPISFRTMQAGTLVVGVLMAIALVVWCHVRAWRTKIDLLQVHFYWTWGILLLVTVTTEQSYTRDLASPWFNVVILGVAIGISFAVGSIQRIVWPATILSMILSIFAAIAVAEQFWRGVFGRDELMYSAGLAAIVLAAIVWQFMELIDQRLGRVTLPRAGLANSNEIRNLPNPVAKNAVHRPAARLALACALVRFVVPVFSYPHFDISSTSAANDIQTAGMILLGFYFTCSLWNFRQFAYASLLIWGVAAIAWTVVKTVTLHEEPLLTFTVALSWYLALAAWIWSQGERLGWIAQRLTIPRPKLISRNARRVLLIATCVVGSALVSYAIHEVLTRPERVHRTIVATIPAALALAVGLLSRGTYQSAWQQISLAMTGVFAVLISWSYLPFPANRQIWLDREVMALTEFGILATFYWGVVGKFLRNENPWKLAVQRSAVNFVVATLVTLVVVLTSEALFYSPQIGAPVSDVNLITVAVVLVALAVTLISMAVYPGRDPLQLSESGRTAYVYVAEVICVLLVAHIRLSRPHWMTTVLAEYWPYAVLAVAFVGVGVGELFQRMKLRVLAEPFQLTAAFLPILPAIGILALPHRSVPAIDLFLAGIVYYALSALRRSVLFGIAAAIAGNAALMVHLHGLEGFRFEQHPQFWLIPPALSVLVAAHVNRRHLTPAQLTAIRYACVATIYVSSTCEVFIISAGKSIIAPMILTMLSVAGIFIGIAMRIRAYLYLGATFTILSLFSMVWHAYQNFRHVGIWWGFAFTIGVATLVLFGVFEKRRGQIQALVLRLQSWEK